MKMERRSKPKVLTAKEVCEYLKIPLSTLYGLTKRGEIRGVKVGKHWRYLDKDIKQYMSDGKFQSDFNTHAQPQASGPARYFNRINCEIKASFKVDLKRRDYPEKQGHIHNLGVEGALFVNGGKMEPIEVGDPVELVFDLPLQDTFQTIAVKGRIVFIQSDEAAYGIKFRQLTWKERRSIKQYVG